MNQQTQHTPKSYLLALDQGSQSTRACVFNQQGDLIHQFSSPVSIQRVDEVQIEQNGDALLQSIDDCLREVFEYIEADQISAVGLACQRSSVLAWDVSTGQALSPVLSWQDTRMADFVASLSSLHEQIHRLSGLPCSPHYGASKMAWLLKQTEPFSRQNLCVSPVASFYIHHLLQTQSQSTPTIDHANALRTQLVSLESLDWEPELLNYFEVERTVLPAIQPIRHNYGKLNLSALPLTAVNGDQTAALFANGAFEDGAALVNLGTGGFILMPSSSRLQIPGLLSSVCDSGADFTQYVCEGTINGAGSALAWSSRRLSVDEWDIHTLTGHEKPSDLLFMNTVSGLGSPWWAAGIEPYWCDHVGRRVSQPDPLQAQIAVLESIVFLVLANLERMQTGGCGIQQLFISGGLSKSDFVCQRLADLSEMRVTRLAESEATAKGIAYLAGGHAEVWNAGFGRCFMPTSNRPLHERYQLFVRQLNSLLNK